MKKILPWLLLLLLLIIFCVWTKKDSIHVTPKSQTETVLAPMVAEKHYIDYTIKQQDDKSYTLNGNFKNTQQQISLSDTVNKANKKLMIKNTSTNGTLLGEPIVELTNKILPHFMDQYTDGEISYTDQKLKISGLAKSYEAQHEMQRLLNTSILASQDNSSVAIATKPIVYTIDKTGDALHLTGTFNDQAQIDTIKTQLPSHATSDFKIKTHHVDNHSLPIVEKILPTFVSKYTNGKIEYTNEKLTVSGLIKTEADLEVMNTLLLNSALTVINHTTVDPSVKAAEAAARKAKELADAEAAAALEAERKAKALADTEAAAALEAERKAKELADAQAAAALEAERKAKALADAEAAAALEAERKAKELADAQAAAALEAERKAKALADAEAAAALEAERKAKELADTQAAAEEEARLKLAKAAELKAKIANLFQLENIEFNVNKSSLTQKGQNTVNKLATILKEYASVNIEIAGHTDSDGSAEYNQKLSQSRVDMVKSKLVAQQIDASRLTAKGYGETKPLVKNTTRANKAKNRRVEINIQGE